MFFLQPTGESQKRISSYLELNLCMCVCATCGQNAPRGKTSNGKNSNLITIYDFALLSFEALNDRLFVVR